MPRRAKPYVHRGWFVSNVGGERHKLCREEDGVEAAEDALAELQQQRRHRGGRGFPKLTVAELVAIFLDNMEVEKPKRTYESYRHALREFAKLHGDRQVREITRLDGQNFKADIMRRTWKPGKNSPAKPYKPKTINHVLMALKRCWNWAIDMELIFPKNPFHKLPMLYSEGRQRVVTDAEFQTMLRHAGDVQFRQILLTLRYTSARPGELRTLTWSMVNWQNHRFVLPRHKTITTMRSPKAKIIPFPPHIEKLLRLLFAEHGAKSQFVFLNTLGEPWTQNGLVKRMAKLRERAGIVPDENGENLVLYSNRHTYITAAASDQLIGGPMLQQLAGHTSATTTQRYAHLANTDIYRASLKVSDALKPKKMGDNASNDRPAAP